MKSPCAKDCPDRLPCEACRRRSKDLGSCSQRMGGQQWPGCVAWMVYWLKSAVLADGKGGGPGGGAGRRIDMDAVKFIRERNRMCKHFRGCNQCPADGMICGTIGETNDPERLVQIVEEWSAAHPRKTRQSVFLEQWPNVAVSENGVIKIRPCNLDVNAKKECLGVTCDYCRRGLWQQEVE